MNVNVNGPVNGVGGGVQVVDLSRGVVVFDDSDHFAARGNQPGLGCFGVFKGALATLVGIEKYLGKAVTRRLPVLFLVFIEIGLQLLIRRRCHGQYVGNEKFHFRSQAAPDDGVILVQPEGQCFLAGQGVSEELISQLPLLGISSICNLIGSIKIMLDAYREEDVDLVYVVYNDFINTMSQRPVLEQGCGIAVADDALETLALGIDPRQQRVDHHVRYGVHRDDAGERAPHS